MAGRPASSLYEKEVVGLLKYYFSQVKFRPMVQVFTYQHPDSLKRQKSMNVFSWINNHADSTILIGAHYDHIGMGGKLSRSFGKTDVHNGADDNASGIALLLGMAQRFGEWMSTEYNYVFVAYSAHEVGLFGSEKFYMKLKPRFRKLALAVNFDMVGRMSKSERWLKIFATENQVARINRIDATRFNLRTKVETDSTLNQLDTRIFYQNGVPCLSLTTGIHDDYHKITDDEAKINYQGICNIQEWLMNYLKHY